MIEEDNLGVQQKEGFERRRGGILQRWAARAEAGRIIPREAGLLSLGSCFKGSVAVLQMCTVVLPPPL
jgi:hypothetical protein